MVLFSPTSRGWGEKEGGCLLGCQGPEQALDDLGAARCQAEASQGSMPLPGGPYLVWAPELPPPQDFPLILSAQVDAQLTGRISQKAERGTKVETVRGQRSPQCPQSALPVLRKPLE